MEVVEHRDLRKRKWEKIIESPTTTPDLLTKLVTVPYLKRLIADFFSEQDWLILRFVCKLFAKEIPFRIFLDQLQFKSFRFCIYTPPLITSTALNGHAALCSWLVYHLDCNQYQNILRLLCKSGQKSGADLESENALLQLSLDDLNESKFALDLKSVQDMMLDCCRSGNQNIFDKICGVLLFEATFSDEIVDPGSLLRKETQFCNTAAGYGHFNMLKYLLELQFKWVSAASASMSKKPEILKFAILEKKLELNEHVLCSALEFETADDWLIDRVNYVYWSFPTVSFSLGKSGNTKLIERCVKNYHVNPSQIVAGACAGGHLHVIESMFPSVDFSVVTKNFMLSVAAEGGHLKVVEWLFKRGADTLGPTTLSAVTMNGHLEVLKWIVNNMPLSFKDVVFGVAAEAGRLEILKWLVEELKWPFPPLDIIGTARENNHYEIVEYALKQGCKIYSNTAKYLLRDRGYIRLHQLVSTAPLLNSLSHSQIGTFTLVNPTLPQNYH
jgi:hypothetical protein